MIEAARQQLIESGLRFGGGGGLLGLDGAAHQFYDIRRDIYAPSYEYRRMVKPISSNRSVFGRRLREARLRAGIAQDRLGVMIGLDEGCSSARMSRYESGVHEPPFQLVKLIAKVLGVSTAYFYCDDDRLAEIIRIYSGLSDGGRDAFLHSALSLNI